MPRRLALQLVLAVIATGGLRPPLARAADWPQFLGPTRDGHSAETKLNWAWPKDGPPVAWKADVGSGWAGPVVAGGKVLLFHRVGDDEVLAALDPESGKELWKAKSPTAYRDDFMFDDGPRATPLVAGGTVFTLGADGDLRARELATGKELWGKTDDAASYSSPAVAEIDGKAAAVFLTRFGLRVLDPADGKVRYELAWKPRIDASVQGATPLVWKDEVFLTVSYSTGAVLAKLKGGELTEVWSNDKSLSSQYNTPVRVGEYLYGLHGRADVGTARLRCVEWKTGAVKWDEANFGVASLVAVDGGMLALTEAGDLVRFDATPDGYQERARATILTKPTRAAPALANGRLFARDGAKLVCVKLK